MLDNIYIYIYTNINLKELCITVIFYGGNKIIFMKLCWFRTMMLPILLIIAELISEWNCNLMQTIGFQFTSRPIL